MDYVIIAIVVVAAVSTALTIFSAVTKVRSLSQKQRQRSEIIAQGERAEAVIHALRQTNVSVDGQPEVILDLTVTKANGEQLDTKLRTAIPITSIPQFQPGCIIQVKYLTIDGQLHFEAAGAYIPMTHR